MQPNLIAAGLLIPLIGLLLAIIGVFMLRRGWWPKRVGNTPHCPNCDYILSGDQSRCPECGMIVKPDTVVRGDRHRRLFLTWIGGGIALLGLFLFLLLVPMLVNAIDWNRHRPLSWLIRNMGGGNSPAWREIQRRLDANLLSENDQNAVAEKGLPAQKLKLTYSGKNVLDFIANRYVENKLTPSQADRFIANVVGINLAVRPVVGLRSNTPFVITGGGRQPGDWWSRWRAVEWQFDDGPIEKNIVLPADGGFSEWTQKNNLPPVAKPGKHRLRIKIEVEMAQDTVGNTKSSWDFKAAGGNRHVHDLVAQFEVIQGETPITTVTSPSASTLAPFLTPTVTFHPDTNFPLQMVLNVKPLPVDVAFDVFVRFDGREYPVGSTDIEKGTTIYWWGGNNSNHAPLMADVILRSSEAAARQTVNLIQIWKGEIVIRDVPIERLATPPATRP